MGDLLTDDVISHKISTEQIYEMSNDPWNQSLMLCPEKKQIVKFLADYANRYLRCKRIVDIGCGLGCYCNFLKNWTKFKQITGIDNARSAIVKANKNFGHLENVNFDVIDVIDRTSAIKLNQHNPDVLFMSDTTWCIIEHLPDFKRFLRENFKGKYLIHILQIPVHQEYTHLISDHQSILKYFNFDYIFDGEFYKNKDEEINCVSYFLAKIK